MHFPECTDSDNGMVHNRQQAIIWTNFDPVHCHIYIYIYIHIYMSPRCHLNIKMPSHWYRNSHYKAKMVSQLSCLYNALWWHHNGRDGVSNHQSHDCLLNRLFGRISKKASKLCVTGLCVGNSPGTSEFPAQMATNVENVSIWWCHHGKFLHLEIVFILKQGPGLKVLKHYDHYVLLL